LKKARLQEIIAEKSLKTGDFILASGAKSNYLFDLKNTLLDPEGANLAADLILATLPEDVTAIGGLELGAFRHLCKKLFNQPAYQNFLREKRKERTRQQEIT
jgi:orotate phosphoribosyltransferase